MFRFLYQAIFRV